MVKRSHTIHQISIHAPTRGATMTDITELYIRKFQSTLLQKERQTGEIMRCKPSNFNPRSYKRSDCCFHKFFVSHKYFNPRSYKRSDLGRRFSVVVYKTYFNPRSYKRSDGSRDTTRKLFQNFNPRSYKRSDSPISLRQWTDWNFNPRSYKRSDQSEAKPYEINKISIHAPTRGATEEVAKDFSKPMISIHAPTRGATFQI